MSARSFGSSVFVTLLVAGAVSVTRAHSETPAPQPAAPPPLKLCVSNIPGSFEVVGQGVPAIELIHDIVQRAGGKVQVVSGGQTRVSVSHCATSVDNAIALITRSSGLSYRILDGTYYVGLDADLIADLPGSDAHAPVDTHYRCRHLDAATLVTLLTRLFPELKIMAGPQFTSPGIQSARSDLSSTNSLESLGAPFKTHDIVLSGPYREVKRAIVMARQLDRQRKQVRVTVRISEVSANALRELGISWNWGLLRADEESKTHPGKSTQYALDALRLGRFDRTPAFIDARLSALEEKNRIRLLSNAHLVLLDGERSFVLSGTKHLYPELQSISSSGVPTYGVKELKVGIYVQVGIQVGVDGDVVMAIYPQVSAVTGYLHVGEAQYPIVETREQQTTVSLRSGETLAIGGLKRDDVVRGVQQIPLLGSIPLLGELFKTRNNTDDKSELLVLITPELVQ